MQPAERPTDAEVRLELDRILNSPGFRNAPRAQEFLRYVVSHALQGDLDGLKERSIGIEIFERAPDYDTGADSIVRVKASELRKRLAQFYLENGQESKVQIVLSSGSYVPEFRWMKQAAERTARWWPIVAIVSVLVLAGIWWMNRPTASAADLFWEPVLRQRVPVVLCVAHPAVYQLSMEVREQFGADRANWPKSLATDLLQRDPAHFVGVGDALTLARVAAFLASKGHATEIRTGNDLSFAELRNSPAVLIGAFTNQWTMEMTKEMRFVFDRVGTGWVLRDQHSADQYWQKPAGETSDYVLISRVVDSKSGQAIVTAAGLGHLGTQVAGEFLTQSDAMGPVLRDAPPDWRKRNAQWILAGELIGRTAGPPRLVASHYW